MKHLLTLFLGLLLNVGGYAQEMNFDVRVVQERPIAKEQVLTAKTIADINPGYPASWIQDYVSVEISTNADGEINKATSRSDILSTDQTALLNSAELGTDIKVKVNYILKNSSGSEAKEMNFAYTIAPDVEAQFPGGYEALEAFVKKEVISKYDIEILKHVQLGTVRFTVSEEGVVINSRIVVPSKNDNLDNLLKEIISSSPLWSPAENSDGMKVSQEFQLSIGNRIGC